MRVTSWSLVAGSGRLIATFRSSRSAASLESGELASRWLNTFGEQCAGPSDPRHRDFYGTTVRVARASSNL
eukprot:1176649-Pleurochrysis_carterae.AAC.1